MVGVRGRERVKFKSMRDQSLEFSHIFFIFNPITRIDLHDCPKELFLDCRFAVHLNYQYQFQNFNHLPCLGCCCSAVLSVPSSVSRSLPLPFFMHSKMLLIRVLRLNCDRSGGMPTYIIMFYHF